MTTRIFYRVITPSSFSNIDTGSLEEAIEAVKDFGDCPNGSFENKVYWRQQSELCKIVKVTEITEEIQFDCDDGELLMDSIDIFGKGE